MTPKPDRTAPAACGARFPVETRDTGPGIIQTCALPSGHGGEHSAVIPATERALAVARNQIAFWFAHRHDSTECRSMAKWSIQRLRKGVVKKESEMEPTPLDLPAFLRWCENNDVRLTSAQKEMASRLLAAEPFSLIGRGMGRTFLLNAIDQFVNEVTHARTT